MATLETRAARRRHVDIDLPLHPQTDNGEHVALLVQRILSDVDDLLGCGASHADVAQALSIASALRAAMSELSSSSKGSVSMSLLEVSAGAVSDRKLS
jgi:hypothetical protein